MNNNNTKQLFIKIHIVGINMFLHKCLLFSSIKNIVKSHNVKYIVGDAKANHIIVITLYTILSLLLLH